MYDTKTGGLLGQRNVSEADFSSLISPLRKAVAEIVQPLRSSSSAGPVFVSPQISPSGPLDVIVKELSPTKTVPAASGPAILYISSDPPGAEVYLGNVKAGNTSPAFQKSDLQAGSKLKITLKKELYHPLSFEVKLTPGVSRYENLKLKPAFGSVFIDSDPQGAAVEISGMKVGETPYRNQQMPSGQLLLTLSKNLYETLSNEIISVKDGEHTEEFFKLDPKFGTLLIESQPSRAKVTLDKREMGETPFQMAVEPGKYTVGLDYPGFKPKRFQVTIAKGKTTKLAGRNTQLIRREGSLSVLVEPPVPGAMVYLDGKEKGNAPVVLQNIPVGKHEIEVRADGESTSQNVIVEEDQNKTIALRLLITPRPTKPFSKSDGPELKKPWYKKWWVWTIVGTVVVGAGVAAASAGGGGGSSSDGGDDDNKDDTNTVTVTW